MISTDDMAAVKGGVMDIAMQDDYKQKLVEGSWLTEVFALPMKTVVKTKMIMTIVMTTIIIIDKLHHVFPWPHPHVLMATGHESLRRRLMQCLILPIIIHVP